MADEFEPGKTYRTRGGDKATIEPSFDKAGFLIGKINDGDHHWSWLLSGRINPGLPDSIYDLLPGAIEDDSDDLHSRINRLVECLEKLERDDLHSRINRLVECLEKLERGTTSDREAMWPRIGELADRLAALERQMPAAHKRTFKGGWLNIYREKSGVVTVGLLHGDKTEADQRASDTRSRSRIACIQIPDITEGEGL